MILSDIEKAKLIAIADDAIALNALKKIFENQVDYHETLNKRITSGFSNERIGEIMRAYKEGLEIMRQGFKQLESFKSIQQKPEETQNPAW